MSNEVRKLPKKTIIIILILIVLFGIGFIILQNLKTQRLVEIVSTLGHKNVQNMEVINKLSVEDKITRYKSKVYKVRFFDKELNKTCIGFIHIKKDNKFEEDLDCK